MAQRKSSQKSKSSKSTKRGKSWWQRFALKVDSALVWRGVTIVIVAVMSVIIVQKFIHAVKISNESKVILSEISGYRESIARDSTLLEELKHDDMLEEYAREHYFMQRKGEVVYIVK